MWSYGLYDLLQIYFCSKKAIAIAQAKGMDINDHFHLTVEMVKLGSGAYRNVENFHLSRMACLIIAENADSTKALVQQARIFSKIRQVYLN